MALPKLTDSTLSRSWNKVSSVSPPSSETSADLRADLRVDLSFPKMSETGGFSSSSSADQGELEGLQYILHPPAPPTHRSSTHRSINAYYKHVERFRVQRVRSVVSLNRSLRSGRPAVLKPLKPWKPPGADRDRLGWIYGNPWSETDPKYVRTSSGQLTKVGGRTNHTGAPYHDQEGSSVDSISWINSRKVSKKSQAGSSDRRVGWAPGLHMKKIGRPARDPTFSGKKPLAKLKPLLRTWGWEKDQSLSKAPEKGTVAFSDEDNTEGTGSVHQDEDDIEHTDGNDNSGDTEDQKGDLLSELVFQEDINISLDFKSEEEEGNEGENVEVQENFEESEKGDVTETTIEDEASNDLDIQSERVEDSGGENSEVQDDAEETMKVYETDNHENDEHENNTETPPGFSGDEVSVSNTEDNDNASDEAVGVPANFSMKDINEQSDPKYLLNLEPPEGDIETLQKRTDLSSDQANSENKTKTSENVPDGEESIHVSETSTSGVVEDSYVDPMEPESYAESPNLEGDSDHDAAGNDENEVHCGREEVDDQEKADDLVEGENSSKSLSDSGDDPNMSSTLFHQEENPIDQDADIPSDTMINESPPSLPDITLDKVVEEIILQIQTKATILDRTMEQGQNAVDFSSFNWKPTSEFFRFGGTTVGKEEVFSFQPASAGHHFPKKRPSLKSFRPKHFHTIRLRDSNIISKE